MLKRTGVILAIIAMMVSISCSSGNSTTTPTQPAGLKTVRQAEIAAQWTVKQVEINLDSDLPILLKLASGDKVDGYFYLEKGSDIDFQITGKTVIYESKRVGGASANITSDRFSFTASEAQGIAYTFTFSPADKANAKKVTPVIFLELIYPKTGEIFEPMGTR